MQKSKTLFHISAGSYDKTLYGFDCCLVPSTTTTTNTTTTNTTSESNVKEITKGVSLQFVPKYVYPAHNGCIKSISIGGKFLATGSSDETIKLYDVENKKELGFMFQQEGSITCLEFFKNTHLLSGSDDGSLCVWRSKDWECLKILRGHKGPINSVSVHPSGMLALTVSKDKHMRTWNLLKGRCAYVTNLKFDYDIVKWTPDGEYYVLVHDKTIVVNRMKDGEQIFTKDMKKRILTLTFLNNSTFAVGGEEDCISILKLADGEVVQTIKGHTNRVRGLAVAPHPYDLESVLLVSASSDGYIKVWSVKPDVKNIHQTEADSLFNENTHARLTCLVSTVPSSTKTNEKQTTTESSTEKGNEDEDDNEDVDDDDDDEEEVRPKSSKKAQQPQSKKKPTTQPTSQSTTNKRLASTVDQDDESDDDHDDDDNDDNEGEEEEEEEKVVKPTQKGHVAKKLRKENNTKIPNNSNVVNNKKKNNEKSGNVSKSTPPNKLVSGKQQLKKK